MPNAQNDRKYDFKSTNGTSEKIESLDHYRGMSIGNTEYGVPIIASARDVGNIGAGYIAGVNGLSWRLARTGFDTYQSTVSGYTTTEGLSTMTAEYYGYLIGRKSTTEWIRTCNMFRSVIDGVVFYMGKIFP